MKIYFKDRQNPFEKTPQEKMRTKVAKLFNKRDLKTYYGSEWKNHLNVPSKKLQSPIKLSF